MSFFEDLGGEPVAYPPPSRVYAWVDVSARESDDGYTRLECVDAEWLDGPARGEALSTPGVAAETEPRVSLLFWRDGKGEEGDVFELGFEDDVEEADSEHFLNLTGPPLLRRVTLLSWPKGEEADRLARATEIGGEDATDDEVRQALAVVPSDLQAVAVYDVGQGSCSALIAGDWPRLYFDLGAGSGRNQRTRPTDLRSLCSNTESVVLSHWHYDHWSLAKQPGIGLVGRTWIVPRQKLGAASATLLGLVRGNGTALVRPAGAPTLREGILSLHSCVGTSKNDSGLALVVRDGAEERPVALPGDCRYRYITDLPDRVHALVAAHHGGRTNAQVAEIPKPEHVGSGQLDPAAVLVYSFGPGNSYRHPLSTSIERHELAGWSNARELRTGERTPAGTLDHQHVHIYWDANAPDAGRFCEMRGLAAQCDLGPCKR